MKTNYSKKDWQKTITALIIIGLIMTTPGFLYIDYIMIPLLNGHIEILTYFTDENIPKQLVEYMIQNIDTDNLTENDIYHMMDVMGSYLVIIAIPIFFYFWVLIKIMFYFGDLSIKFLKYMKLYPTMNLILIYNHKNKQKTKRLLYWK